MNWTHLKTLLALYEEGSMLAAAKKVGVEHTTISRQIRSLEKDIGYSLITPPNKLTAAALQIVPAIKAMQRLSNEIEKEIENE